MKTMTNIYYQAKTRTTNSIAFLLLLLLLLPGVTRAQFAGIWYIDNEDQHSQTSDKRWYLVPAGNPQQPNAIDAYYSPDHYTTDGDPEKPFLTTYKTNKDANSIWVIKESGESGYYFVIHALTGKYVIFEPPQPNDSDKQRKSMHLQTIDDGFYNPATNENFKFAITGSVGGNINISPKSRTTGNMYWNPAGNNQNQYYGLGSPLFRNGMIGLWNDGNGNSIWHFEDASSAVVLAPVIGDVNEDNTFIITSPAAAFATIHYTTDGTTPDASTGIEVVSGTPIYVTDSWIVNAVGVVGTSVTPVAGPKIINPVCAQPIISYDNNTQTVSITSATDGADIYYTIDGNNPTTSSTEYSGPFSVTTSITIKAIATHAGLPNSSIATLSLDQVATPTIQNNGDNAVSITCATEDATIYYTTDGTTPTTSSNLYSGPMQDNISGVTIKAIAVKENMINSEIGSGMVTLQCDSPVIARHGNTGFSITCPFPASGVVIYYTTDGSTPTTSSSSTTSGSIVSSALPVTVKAFAVASGYNNSDVVIVTLTPGLNGYGTSIDPYTIESEGDLTYFYSYANNPAEAAKHYRVTNSDSLDFSTVGTITLPFCGSFDGGTCILTGLTHPLFETVDGGVVKNVTLKNVAINSSEDTIGAIASVVKGYSRIYNCGILPNSANFPDGTHPTVVTSGNCAGGLVGSLRDDSRVINCYSYADVQATNTASGIVGRNAIASTTAVTDGKYANLRTAVVNCLFYGNITGGASQYGVYGGELITNAAATGISSYNYYCNGSTFTTATGEPTAYNCSFPADVRYLTQVEFHRSLLNSNRELCGWWVGSETAPSTLTTAEVQAVPKDASLIYKWVVDPNLAPYPILKPFGKYPSVVNGNTGTPWFNRATANPYEGKQLGTLTVTVKPGDQSTAADQVLYLPITDMDTLHYDFGYRKVQLPYFNTVFGNPQGDTWADKYAGNYTDYVVTGWKVTAVTGGTKGTFVANWETGYNFADRKCTDKDLYSVSGRVFAQGGNYYVPDGVTAITIEAYWGKAIYVRNNEASYDRVNITEGTTGTHFAPAGTRDNNVNGNTIQTTSIAGTLTQANIDAKKTVYDYALVLVGNLQESRGGYNVIHTSQNTRGFTIMSVDLDFDEEPDYCLEWQLGTKTDRYIINPVRFDFLPVVELGIAGKTHGSTNFFSLGCYYALGHYEVTETAFIRYGQFEFDRSERDNGPIILNGGIFEQFTKGTKSNNNAKHITYIIVGGHLVMPSFTPGAHVSAGSAFTTRHCAVNALGGDFTNFYLTGGYNESVVPNEDNPHCYIDGGRFGQVAAAYKEGIWGDVTWRINHAIIGEFYGGGMMAQSTGTNYKIVKGSIDVVIDSSIVRKYCGGPKFGDMVSGKTVTTSATGTIFTQYFGAGNGGTNYVQYTSTDVSNSGPYSVSTWNSTVSGKYHPGQYRSTDHNYEANYDYEVINISTGTSPGLVVNRSYYYAAQFATTNTGNVTNTLTGCTILTNFYGGGFLGGVVGDVTSTLTDSRVMGSVYGAGYSASVPTVTIHNIDKTPPVANIYTGMIKPQSGGTSNTYYWSHSHGTTASPITAASPATHDTAYFYTELSLDNLGSVNNNVYLTIGGNTVIGTREKGLLKAGTGNVFGGGEESAVGGNTEVRIYGHHNIFGNVYGGGNEGPVSGNTKVIVNKEK